MATPRSSSKTAPSPAANPRQRAAPLKAAPAVKDECHLASDLTIVGIGASAGGLEALVVREDPPKGFLGDVEGQDRLGRR